MHTLKKCICTYPKIYDIRGLETLIFLRNYRFSINRKVFHGVTLNILCKNIAELKNNIIMKNALRLLALAVS